MSKQITSDELLGLLVGTPDLEESGERMRRARQVYFDAMTVSGELLARHLKVRITGPADSLYGDIMIGFSPVKADDPLPTQLEDYDQDGDWEYLVHLDFDDPAQPQLCK